MRVREAVEQAVGAVSSGNWVLAPPSLRRGMREGSRSADVSEVSAPETLADLALTQVELSQEAVALHRAHDLLRQSQPRRDHSGVGERHEV